MVTNRVTVSPALRRAVWQKRAEGVRQNELARACGLHPTVFSAILNNIRPIEPRDPRVLSIARMLGVSTAEAFTVVRPGPCRPTHEPALVR